jgi:hypothetical protein
MSSGIEPVDIVDPWLYSTLANDPQITAAVAKRISNGGALGPTATPFITWDMNSSRDILAHDGSVIFNESLFEIKVVGQGGSFAPVAPIGKRMDFLLGAATNVEVPGKGWVSSRRDRVIRYVELDDNVQYRHLGAIYRITAHAL